MSAGPAPCPAAGSSLQGLGSADPVLPHAGRSRRDTRQELRTFAGSAKELLIPLTSVPQAPAVPGAALLTGSPHLPGHSPTSGCSWGGVSGNRLQNLH